MVQIPAAWLTPRIHAEALTGLNKAACRSLGIAETPCCILQSHFGASKHIQSAMDKPHTGKNPS